MLVHRLSLRVSSSVGRVPFESAASFSDICRIPLDISSSKTRRRPSVARTPWVALRKGAHLYRTPTNRRTIGSTMDRRASTCHFQFGRSTFALFLLTKASEKNGNDLVGVYWFFSEQMENRIKFFFFLFLFGYVFNLAMTKLIQSTERFRYSFGIVEFGNSSSWSEEREREKRDKRERSAERRRNYVGVAFSFAVLGQILRSIEQILRLLDDQLVGRQGLRAHDHRSLLRIDLRI